MNSNFSTNLSFHFLGKEKICQSPADTNPGSWVFVWNDHRIWKSSHVFPQLLITESPRKGHNLGTILVTLQPNRTVWKTSLSQAFPSYQFQTLGAINFNLRWSASWLPQNTTTTLFGGLVNTTRKRWWKHINASFFGWKQIDRWIDNWALWSFCDGLVVLSILESVECSWR